MPKTISLIVLLLLLISDTIFSQYHSSNSYNLADYINDNSHGVLIDLGAKSSFDEYYILSDIVLSEKLAFNIKLSSIDRSYGDIGQIKITGRYLTSTSIALGGSFSTNSRAGHDIAVYSVIPLNIFRQSIISKTGLSYYYDLKNENKIENMGYFLSLSKRFLQYEDLKANIELFVSRSKIPCHIYKFAAISSNYEYNLVDDLYIQASAGINVLDNPGTHFIASAKLSYVF